MLRANDSDYSDTEEGCTFRGWARLKPLHSGDQYWSENSLVPFMFPLDLENGYIISSRNDESVDLLILDGRDDEEGALPVNATLTVNKNGEVWLDRAAGRNAEVSVNGEAIEAGKTWRVPLAYGSTVSFGQSQYIFEKCKGIFHAALKAMDDVTSCHVCRTEDRKNLRVLACGHNICPACCTQVRSQPLVGRRILRHDGRQGQRQQRHAVVEFELQPDARAPPRCSVCRSQVMAGVASSAIGSLTASDMGKLVADVKDLDASRPMCDQCGNKRGLFTARDYAYCKQCDQLVCAACALSWHRNHDQKRPVDHYRSLDEVNYNLEAAKRKISAIESRQKNVVDDVENARIANGRGAEGKAMQRSFDSLRQKIVQCQQQLAAIQKRKRALARGWDETSRRLMETLEQHVKEFHEIEMFIEELKMGTVSLSITSSSSDDESSSAMLAEGLPTAPGTSCTI